MPHPISARLELRQDRPTLLLNDEPVAPLLYALSDCPGARWSWEEVPARNIAEFARRGVRLFQLDIWFEQMLTAAGTLDISLAQRQIAGVRAVAPEGAVMLRLHVNPPPTWCAEHPAECVGYADTEPEDPPRHGLYRPLADDAQRPTRASFYSRPWQDWAHARLREFCAALAATPEGDALFGLQIANGVYGEWHQFGFLHHDPDTGPAATAAFRDWLRAKYQTAPILAAAWNQPGLTFEAVSVPDSPARETAALGILRDPMTQQPVIDYFTFQHHALTSIVLELAATAKTAWPRPLITAAFFGYFYSIFGRQAAGAQLAVAEALASPHLDCLCSPQSYEPAARDFGGTGNARGLIGAVRRAGKLWLDEMDMPTSHVGCPWDAKFKSTPSDDIAIHRRNVLQPVTRGGGQWWYDFGPIGATPDFARGGNCGWWDTPELLADVSALHHITTERQSDAFLRPADVLLVHDPMSFCHTVSQRHPQAKFGELPTTTSDPVTPLLVDDLLHALYHSGLCFDEALVDELPSLDLSPYRLVILATTPMLDAAQRTCLQERVATDGRHVLALGYTGWSDGNHLDPQLATALTGVTTRSHHPTEACQTWTFAELNPSKTLPASLALPAFEPAPADEVIARWPDGTAAAVRHPADSPAAATWWVSALPPTDPELVRAIAVTAGCHTYNDVAETTLVGDGLIVVHTIDGGPRRLQWPGGPAIQTELAPRSTTVFCGPTGGRLLG
ncbi:hypothetical protein [Actomonas aquatica]|uniref:Glycoside hydrolase family 42 N-terminal domain-containing protein n=1 Tax=Actomonas aquatica TaxID=2866162 RepID=A0ABZ1CD24_9BACT|nr:hypothetical protein [Opitutus sp. WL0086]WRQ89560.1 hypothetical protein K1X11_009080 [Opitutus sp. WL0086]